MMKRIKIVLLLSLVVGKGYAQNVISLTQALKTTTEQNPYMKVGALGVDASRADIVTAKLRPNPILNNQSLQALRPSQLANNPKLLTGESMQTWWQLTKEFQLSGQRKNRIDYANQNVKLAEKEYAEFQRGLYTDVAFKWVEAWNTRKQIDLLKTAVNNIDTLVTINSYRFKKQIITETELYRTQLIAKQYKIQISELNQELKQKLNELQLMIGAKENLSISTSADLGVDSFLKVDSLLADAYASRTDLQYFQTRQGVMESNIKLQQSLAFPRTEAGFIYNPQNTLPYFGIYATVELPFFDRNQGEIKKAKVQREQALTQIEAVQNTIRTEVQNASLQRETNQNNLKSYALITEQADQILKNVRYSYSVGGTTIIDFLEAQRSWLETQQQYTNLLHKYHQSQIQLLSVTGLINKLAQ
ncbi:TolC family protein [Flectobacillus sp. DC10W]|uniref:TolC family protein n=1 Tax=Flectobacillus longus TaxID=2984207 RepID=A0ABT6YIT8_9BACT|nr:TolC family protein [Flectobacillus longus]MDI9863352.1 TolC family protein [Flectobacillus longus]